jgi:ABC-type Fe3+-hydroxamate transport system substrate-binding protein
VTFAYLIWRDPLMAVNDDTFVSQLLQLANGVNVLAGGDARYPTVEPESLGALAPDVVFLSSEPFPFAQKHVGELAALTGLSADAFLLVDGEMLSWHGSRTPRGIDYAEEVISLVRARRPNGA